MTFVHDTIKTRSAVPPPTAIGTRKDERRPSRRTRSSPSPRASCWTSGTNETWSSSTASRRVGKSSRSASSPESRIPGGAVQTSSSVRPRSRHRIAVSAPNVAAASLQIAAAALSTLSVWKRGETRRIRSRPRRASCSPSYRRARSSACPPSAPASATIAPASSWADPGSSKSRLSAPTTSPATVTGTAIARCA